MNLKKQSIGMTIGQHIVQTQREFAPNASGEFNFLLQEILIAAKIIRNKIALSDIAEILGSTDDVNIQGEVVKVLDVVSNDIMKNRLLKSGLVCVIVSEEDKRPCFPKEKYSGGKYVVAMDPLDGSSNIDCNIPIGTIIGIWERLTDRNQTPGQSDILQPGNKMVCGAYILYGPSCMCVYATSVGSVNGFTYDHTIGEFILTHKNITYPTFSKCYSINESYTYIWPPEIKNLVNWIKTPNNEEHRPYTARYVGSLVADFHRNLLYGGIYMYPVDPRTNSCKLRLLYECAPLAFISAKAGGSASNGQTNILDIIPVHIHQREALYIGNKLDVQIAESFLSGKKYE